VGDTCIIQNYVDLEAGPTARDPACGPLTYDGHDGLDFRVTAERARAGVPVLAPAAGVVRSVRDGERDDAYTKGGRNAVQGRECGNGIVLAHEGGFSTQLCHLRANSVRVRTGDRVSQGQAIGLVGTSGMAEFPHVHLTLRRNNAVLDPRTGEVLAAATCQAAPSPAGTHWSPRARAQLDYRGTQLFAFGFTGTPPTEGARAEDFPHNATLTAPALVFWAVAVGPRAGDVLRVRLFAPDGDLVAEATRTQPRDQAQAWLFAGRRRTADRWAPGVYRGEAWLGRAGEVLSTHTERLVLKPE
jgi:hypothetical protein